MDENGKCSVCEEFKNGLSAVIISSPRHIPLGWIVPPLRTLIDNIGTDMYRSLIVNNMDFCETYYDLSTDKLKQYD